MPPPSSSRPIATPAKKTAAQTAVPSRNKPGKLRAATAVDWLGQDLSFAQLARQTERLLAIQTLISKQFKLPHLSVVKADEAESTLILMVSNAGQAAKLRQLEPEILKFLCHSGWEFSRIKVRPQTVFAPPAVTKSLPRPPISAKSLQSIADSSDTLPDGPIKRALANLAKHSKERSAN